MGKPPWTPADSRRLVQLGYEIALTPQDDEIGRIRVATAKLELEQLKNPTLKALICHPDDVEQMRRRAASLAPAVWREPPGAWEFTGLGPRVYVSRAAPIGRPIEIYDTGLLRAITGGYTLAADR